jgi:hypothetical protein
MMMASSAKWVTPARKAMLAGDWKHGTYYLALFREPLPITTAKYSAVNEIKAQGYRAGGVQIASPVVGTDGDFAVLQFSGMAAWKGATIRARYGQIYSDYKTLLVFDLGEDVSSTNDTFKVHLSDFAIYL